MDTYCLIDMDGYADGSIVGSIVGSSVAALMFDTSSSVPLLKAPCNIESTGNSSEICFVVMRIKSSSDIVDDNMSESSTDSDDNTSESCSGSSN